MEEKKITFEDIKKANETIKTMTISRTDKKTGKEISKEYAEVNQRVKAFRMVYPTGTIQTEMVSNEDGICVFKAYIYIPEYVENAKSEGIYVVNNQRLIATGTAYEKESASFINQTSYIENCETSAIGRALGMAGFGIDTSIASYEEVANAIANQDKSVKKTTKDIKALPEQVEIIANGCGSEENIKKLCNQHKVESLSDLTLEQASTIIKKLEERKKKEGNENE